MSTTAQDAASPASSPAAKSQAAANGLASTPLSTVGAKFIVAITGMGLTLFVLVHMLGNLQVFLGREVMNHYAHLLKSNPEILWPFRIGLLVFLVAHICVVVSLKVKNRSARPLGYAYQRQLEEANLASRTMLLTGLVILAFLIYHLLHFTIGVILPGQFAENLPPDDEGRPDVYAMVILGFQQPLVTISYIVAQLFLGLHLWHGAYGMFQSLGINRPRWAVCLRRTGMGITLAVVGGNILIPLLILMGLYPDPV